MTEPPVDLMSIIEKGGILMYPILAISIVALAIAIERFWSLRRATNASREFLDTLRTTLRQNRIQEAIGMCDETNAPIARIVRAGLLKHSRGRDEIRQAMEDAGRLEAPRLERYLGALATCVNVAPLMGLLGTVQGLIKCFAQVALKHGQVNPADLAEGMSNALITTSGGLCVAIPALVVYNYLIARVDNIVLEMEAASSEILDLITSTQEDRDR